MQFGWAEGSRMSSKDPQEIGKELTKLRKEYGGSLTAEVVVTAAERKSSPLHELFEWDDAEAAHQFRLEQARGVLRHIIVIDDKNDTSRRAFVQVTFEDARAYVDTVDALKDEDLRIQVLGRARAEMESFSRKYNELQELAEVIDAMGKAQPRLKRVLARAGGKK